MVNKYFINDNFLSGEETNLANIKLQGGTSRSIRNCLSAIEIPSINVYSTSETMLIKTDIKERDTKGNRNT